MSLSLKGVLSNMVTDYDETLALTLSLLKELNRNHGVITLIRFISLKGVLYNLVLDDEIPEIYISPLKFKVIDP